MDLVLQRTQYTSTGILGSLSTVDGKQIAVTLEHAYRDPIKSVYFAKIPVGQYTCVRGMHLLEGMTNEFETFEVNNVPGHSDILFHVGNYNCDSSGCILLGQTVLGSSPDMMITNSKVTFRNFMHLQDGIGAFELTVLA